MLVNNKFNITNPKLLRFNGCHPNIQKVRNIDATKTYVQKDGKFLETGSYLTKLEQK